MSIASLIPTQSNSAILAIVRISGKQYLLRQTFFGSSQLGLYDLNDVCLRIYQATRLGALVARAISMQRVEPSLFQVVMVAA